jgi:hypothetical protein
MSNTKKNIYTRDKQLLEEIMNNVFSLVYLICHNIIRNIKKSPKLRLINIISIFSFSEYT